MLKYLRGIPGDVVLINKYDQIFINGEALSVGDLSYGADKLGLDTTKFRGERVLGPDEYWFFGTSYQSFDSRYWGAVNAESIMGRAYPIM